ncbi:MAG TPA: hypothetical protein VGN32_11900 [Ktedonobacterales bacterium]|nr:hypothetical protein [Ktedonobacterales bacterium]
MGRFVAGYKGAVTTAINTRRNTPGITIWQRNYHEHVIRNEDDMTRIRAYIADNPARWTTDPENIVLHSSHL